MVDSSITRDTRLDAQDVSEPGKWAPVKHLRSVLAGIDFSPPSANALRQATRIARWNEAALHVVHVIDMVVVTDLAAALSPFQQRIQEGLLRDVQTAWTEFRARAGLGVAQPQFEVEVDNRLAAMLRQVKRHSADLLVLGTHGLDEPDRGTGPLAASCIRQAPCDVLLVRDPHDGPFKVVVACIDFSATSRRVLDQAVRIAAQDGAALHVLHVFRPPWQVLPFQSSLLYVPNSVRQDCREALRRQLEEFCAPLRHEMIFAHATYTIYEHASYGRGIYDYASSVGATLVVLGTRGRSNVRDVLIGSTAERVVRRTPCSVLAIKPVDATGTLATT